MTLSEFLYNIKYAYNTKEIIVSRTTGKIPVCVIEPNDDIELLFAANNYLYADEEIDCIEATETGVITIWLNCPKRQ